QTGCARSRTAGMRAFAEVGDTGATTAAIARRAGVTQPLVHHHFGSKEGLWQALVDELFGSCKAALEETRAAHRGKPADTRFAALLRTLVRFCGTNPHLP